MITPFQTAILKDFLKSKHPNSEIKDVAVYEPNGASMYTQYKVKEGNEWIQKQHILSLWTMLDFLYSKMEFQETEAPTTVEFGVDLGLQDDNLHSPFAVDLNTNFNSAAFRDAWERFYDSRIEIDNHLTVTKAKEIIGRLNNQSEKHAIECLEKAIVNKWATVYPIEKPLYKTT
ncbi:hypothetical protein ACE193_21265 [Bernardetia sp. OM2101]|uniref:hypothetical protein n=1 Tax=Bernardetia sp. OM2101 TaxID=3344876 RepID=UPI0035CEE240